MFKKCIVMCFVLLISAGCLESFALIGGGAAGGMTLMRVLDQQQKVIRDDIAMMEAQLEQEKAEFAEVTDEIEKEKLRQQIENTETVLADLKDADEAISRAKEGLNVNWQDPQSVIPFAGAALMTIFGIWQRREKRKNQTALAEVVAGGQEFKKLAKENGVSDPALKAFGIAMNDKQSPETKKLVAVIKA